MNRIPVGPSTRLSKIATRGLRWHYTSTWTAWWRAKCDLRWCGASRRATTYITRPSYHYYIVSRDRNHSSTTKIHYQTWISNMSSLSAFVFKARFYPFHCILVFWFECLSAFAAFGIHPGCLPHIVYINHKLRHMSETRKIVSRYESWMYTYFYGIMLLGDLFPVRSSARDLWVFYGADLVNWLYQKWDI